MRHSVYVLFGLIPYILHVSCILSSNHKFAASKEVQIAHKLLIITCRCRAESLMHPYCVILTTSYGIHIGDALPLATGYLGEKHVGLSRETPSIAPN